jgi:hypothetical protein
MTDVLVFTRLHGSTPTIISGPEHIRINFGQVWIDFKDGAVIASDNDMHEIFNLPANLKAVGDKEGRG